MTGVAQITGRARKWLAQTALADRILCRRADRIVAAAGLLVAFEDCRHLIDVGAGTGHISEALAVRLRETRFSLVDPDWHPIARASGRMDRTAAGRWQAHDGLAQSLPFASGSADAILIAFAMHHMSYRTQTRALVEAFRVLAAGGRLVVLEDTPATYTERRRTLLADRLLNCEIVSGLHNYRSQGAWTQAIEGQGFVDVQSRSIGAIPPYVTVARVPHSAIFARRPSVREKFSGNAEKAALSSS